MNRSPGPAADASETPRQGHAHVERRGLPLWLALVFALLCGAITALQSRINGALGAEFGDGYTAAAISFSSGLVILLIAMLFWRPGRQGFARVAEGLRSGQLRWWMLLGGLGGASFVLSQGLVASVLGVALFTVAIVAGQTLSGMMADKWGLGPGGRHPLTASRLIGSIVALGAVGWSVSAQITVGVPLWMLLLPLIAGLLVGGQQAVNGRVRVTAQSALTATLINFISGSIVLVAAMLVHVAIVGWPRTIPGDWWLYSGGLIGCIFIAAAAMLVRSTGVLLFGLASVAGQLVAALALDIFAPIEGHTLGFATIGGTVLGVVGVAIASMRRRHRHSAVGSEAHSEASATAS